MTQLIILALLETEKYKAPVYAILQRTFKFLFNSCFLLSESTNMTGRLFSSRQALTEQDSVRVSRVSAADKGVFPCRILLAV